MMLCSVNLSPWNWVKLIEKDISKTIFFKNHDNLTSDRNTLNKLSSSAKNVTGSKEATT